MQIADHPTGKAYREKRIDFRDAPAAPATAKLKRTVVTGDAVEAGFVGIFEPSTLAKLRLYSSFPKNPRTASVIPQ